MRARMDDRSAATRFLELTQVLAAGLWSQEVDPVTLALVSGADGTVTMAEQLAVLASAFETPEPVLTAMAGPIVTQLVERGLLTPSP